MVIYLQFFRMLPYRAGAVRAFLRSCRFCLLLDTAKSSGSTQIDAHIGVSERDLIRFEAGHIARLADGAAVVSQGDTSVSFGSTGNFRMKYIAQFVFSSIKGINNPEIFPPCASTCADNL